MGAADHNEILTKATRRAWQLEPRLARILKPILDAAGTDAARTFEQQATGMLLQIPETLNASGAPNSRSTMIALRPQPDERKRIGELTGADPDQLHVTLCYLGETEGPLDKLAEQLHRVGGEHGPMSGTIAGVGYFENNGDGHPVIMLPSVPGLIEARVAATAALHRAGIDYSRRYGYVPHMTAEYSETPGVNPDIQRVVGMPVSFSSLHIVRGDQEEIEVPLTGSMPVTASLTADAAWTPPSPNALVDTDKLVKQLRTKTDPVRQAVVEAAMTPTLEEAGLDFDVTNPFTAKVLAQSGSQITNIAETTQRNVMAIIAKSYEEGLSIPDTAKAIRAGMKEASLDRATLIARTELAGAVNGGSLAAVQISSKATGDTLYKRWLTAPGAHYPRHENYEGLDGQTTTLDGLFEVGDAQLQHPGDPDGPPEEVCNC